MPYIVTLKRRERQGDPGIVLPDPEPVVSRRAVVTLDEVRGEVEEEVYRITGEPVAADFPDEGGTVGPLPDGTVIEVKATDWRRLAGESDLTENEASNLAYEPGRDAIACAAYNAAQKETA